MARFVAAARRRAREHAELSWGVLAGVLRTIDARDGRAARHAAAVAAFSRDIARACGMDRHTCELAHTAGLLHDVGRFALADWIMEHDGEITPESWEGIRRHPELGGGVLADLGLYGPVAEIVGAHHERLDGRGYPAGIAGEEIPELARVVAVAEVYDTLTAPDTYRTPIGSFEAVRELRRVAGSQLDGRFVEALAEVLAGQGTEYRHAGGADFDRALEIERRVGDATMRWFRRRCSGPRSPRTGRRPARARRRTRRPAAG
jgi:HD-GYP domain-containing protein (c-di-GMP phosphodiesterase class II)